MTQQQTLKLENAPAYLRKISINVLNKNADYTLFTLPIESVPLTFEQLDTFMGAHTSRSWYEQRPDGAWYPMPWWNRRDSGNFELDEKLVCNTATVTIDGTDYVFEEYCVDEEADEEPEGEDKRPAARISKIKLKPTPGGTTLLSFHMQVRALAGASRDALLEHMYRAIAVTFAEPMAVAKKAQQQSLPLPTPESDAKLDQQLSRPEEFQGKTGAELDAEMRARHPEASAEVMGADTPTGEVLEQSAPSSEELESFEEGATAQVAAFNAKPGEVIDGRSERVKQQDRRRRGGRASTH